MVLKISKQFSRMVSVMKQILVAIAMAGLLQAGAPRESSATSSIPYCPSLISFCPGSWLAEYCRLTLFSDSSLVIPIPSKHKSFNAQTQVS